MNDFEIISTNEVRVTTVHGHFRIRDASIKRIKDIDKHISSALILGAKLSHSSEKELIEKELERMYAARAKLKTFVLAAQAEITKYYSS